MKFRTFIKISLKSHFSHFGAETASPWQGLYKGWREYIILQDFEVFLAKKCTFWSFRVPRGSPPGRALEAGPLALSVEGSASDERAGPPIGGPGL